MSISPRRLVALGGGFTLLSALTAFTASSDAVSAPVPIPAGALSCAEPVHVPGQGLSCAVEGGWEVLLADGSVSRTHGADPPPPEGYGSHGGPNATPSDPVCVNSTQYGIRVVYAVPADKPSQYATRLATIRATVREMNGRINEAGIEAGNKRVDMKVLCDATGNIAVSSATFPTTSANDGYATILYDMQNAGFTSPLAKYVLLYDDDVASGCGHANVPDADDSPGATNANNVGPDYAFNYGAFGTTCGGSFVPLHELVHSLGAVLLTAPHTSGNHHCSDGDDLMCYYDTSMGNNACTTGGSYCVNTCFDYDHVDCGHDDYFHADPPSGNWLATHWNLGSTVNRFLQNSGASTSSEWRQEAEAFATRPVGGSCTSSTASGGTCWNIWSNGSISTTTASLTAQTKRVTVSALGDPAGGVWPQMKVYVDGTQVMDVAVSQDVWRSYSAAITLPAGTHTIQVQYTNDGSVDGNDRNLLVDYASVSNAPQTWFQEVESFTTRTAGGLTPSGGASGSAYWNLWSNGYVEHAISAPYASQHEIRVVARGDVAGGVWPQMKVYVDGALVLTQTVATTTWTSYPIRRVLSAGSHTLRVEFTNDAMIGTEDRNLKLDYAALYS